MGSPRQLDDLIGSVADGSPIDWNDVDGKALDDGERELLRHLRLVAGVAEVHRTQIGDPESPTDPALVLSPGDRWGQLLLIEKIGEGTYGDVYRARDTWLDREVALKLLKPFGGTDMALFRVLQEARTLARVLHPNVVTVHGADVRHGRVGLWMEFVKGSTLEQLEVAGGQFSAEEAAAIGQQICSALAAVHAAGLVHRDVTARNVMRDHTGRVVLMDFGTGRQQASTGDARTAGTPVYLAPEVLEGGEGTPQSDIYSLGVLLFRLVTGQFPISAASIAALKDAHARGGRQPLGELRSDLPTPFVRVVERALSPNPVDRFPDARSMHDAVTALRPSQLTAAEASAVPARIRGRAAWWTGVAAAAVVGLAAWATSSNDSRIAPRTLVSTGRVVLIGVLPFESLSADGSDDYLSQAVPMELTTTLGRVGAVKVVPWTFMKRFGESNTSLSDVGGQTGADTIIEGSVQRSPAGTSGDQRRVQVGIRMFHTSTGSLIWSGTFSRAIGEFFVLQSEVAREIAAKINVVAAQREQVALSGGRTVSPEAMELYLQARQAWESYSGQFNAAVTLYQRAIQEEPDFAEAHAGLAAAYALQSAYMGSDAQPALARALESADRAIAIDPMLASAWSTRAFAKLALAWDWGGAEKDFTRALQLDPHSAMAHSDYSNYLTIVGRHAEAIEEARIAEDRDRFSPVFSRKVAWAYYHARRYDDAIAQARKTLELDTDYVPARTILARAYVQAGRPAEGVTELTKVREGNEAMLAMVYAAAGRRGDAERLLEEVVSPGPAQLRRPYTIALANVALGQTDAALDWLERAYVARDPNLAHLAVDPALDDVRGDPRFAALIDRMRLR